MPMESWTYVWACFFTMITVIVINKKQINSFVYQLLKYSKILLKYRNMRKRSFRDLMQTLHPMEKVCIKSACQILADVQTLQKSA